jgi:hypothetical protein
VSYIEIVDRSNSACALRDKARQHALFRLNKTAFVTVAVPSVGDVTVKETSISTSPFPGNPPVAHCTVGLVTTGLEPLLMDEGPPPARGWTKK